MATDQKRHYCRDCEDYTLHRRERMTEAVGLILTILSFGLYLPIWVLTFIYGRCQPYRCTYCGKVYRY